MSRGGAREKNGRFYAHARYGRAKRLEFRVPWAKTLAEAEERAGVIGELAEQLIAVGRRDLVKGTARELAEAATPARLVRVLRAVDAIVKGARVAPTEDITFGEWARGYTSGDLATKHPDHVKARDHSDDLSRLRKYILPIVADVPVVRFELAHAMKVMSSLPEMSSGNRRQVAQIMGRLMHLAVMPGQLVKVSPLPRGWLPKVKQARHYSCLYPREEVRFLAHEGTSEAFRLFCGVLSREGMRLAELLDSEWWQWGLDVADDRVSFTVTRTKGGDPRMWVCRPDVGRAMRVWRERNPGLAKPFAYVEALGDRTKLAERFRAGLKAAGVTRAELFESTEHTAQLRAHDMRATFVTISLAEGKPERWIRDRTGHKSTSMVDRYRRLARQLADLQVGPLVELDEALGWWKGGGKETGATVPPEARPGGEADGTLVEVRTRAEVAESVDAADSKFAQPSPEVAGRAETPVESDVSARAETGFHHLSTTPLATPDDAGGVLTPGDLERSTDGLDVDSKGPAKALTRAAEGLAVERATWDAFDELERAVGDDEGS